jgi:protein RecA
MAKKKKEMAKEFSASDFYKELGENHCNQSVDYYLTTGLKQLDFALSGRYYGGGFGAGRIHEIYGGESSGKTMIATMVMAAAQAAGGIAMFLDYEHSFDQYRAMTLGLNIDNTSGKWFYQQPDTAEDGFEKIEKIVNMLIESESTVPVCIVVDSVASMNTREELEAGFNQNMRTKLSLAATMSSSLKRIKSLVSSSNVTLLFLNQTRTNPSQTFGDSDVVAGGNALKFYASTRTKLSKGFKIKDGDNVVGENVKAMTLKNKLFMPFKEAKFKTDFSIGIDMYVSHFDELNERLGLITDDETQWLHMTSKGRYTMDGVKYHGWNKLKEGLLTVDGAYDKMLALFPIEEASEKA